MPLDEAPLSDDPRTWPAGRRLDAAVAAELVSMQYPARAARQSRWSSDARAVDALIDELSSVVLMKGPWHVTLTCDGRRWPKWECLITDDVGAWEAEGCGDSLALAFCRALLHIAPCP